MSSPSPSPPERAGSHQASGTVTGRVVANPHPAFRDAAFLQHGFRPFFLAASLWAVIGVALWLLIFSGRVEIPTGFAPLVWHAHEMLFGFVAAAVAGFMLTAVPNWTGRRPLAGLKLLGLFLLWLAGRIAVSISAIIGAELAAAIDLSFLIVLFAFVLREIVVSRSWRNLPVVAALVGLIGANALMHAETLGWLATAAIGERLAIGVLVLLISLIGGRIIPTFTRNWLMKRGTDALPILFGRFDRICILVLLLALIFWVALPDAIVTAVLLLLAGTLSLIRLLRWRGTRTLSEPLLWSLHLGFLWVPAGLLLLGASAFFPAILATAGLHALMAGAAASMILAVMTRATLGHTGRELQADGATAVIYGTIFVAAAMRVAAVSLPAVYLPLLVASALLWSAAFLLFARHSGPMLLRPSTTDPNFIATARPG